MPRVTKKTTAQNPMGPFLPRNIAVFIDGTWNDAGAGKKTNVRKLFEATLEGFHAGRIHSRLYVPGVGKKPKVDQGLIQDEDYKVALERTLKTELPMGMGFVARSFAGGAFGKGTAARIKATYLHICRNYSNKRGDKVFLFGFSRGALAARSLAGFAERVGLLLADKLQHIERAYEIYESSEDPAQTELADFLEKLTGIRVVTKDSEYYLQLHFLGVWDTVASLGLPSRLQWFSAPFTEKHHVDVPPSVMTARHALALHELRDLFEPLLWDDVTHQDLKQVWFTGAHADVGGGYRVGEDGLSDIALRWMAKEAAMAGLLTADSATWQNPSTTEFLVHHEIKGLFLGTMPAPRSWLTSHEHKGYSNHHFHISAVNYVREVNRGPYNFRLDFVNSALRKVDSLSLQKVLMLALCGQGILK